MQSIKKKALILGLNYSFVENEKVLTGCVNDACNIKAYLETLNFSNIDLITDDIKDNVDKLSWKGIIILLQNLCISSWTDDLDVVVFHYSGHGRQKPDLDNDEEDGLDEGLVPTDYKKTGIITDDILISIFKKFNPKTRILCIFDCCHSGSILDLNYTVINGRLTKQYDMKIDSVNPVSPFIICLSGARDNEIAGEIHKKLDTGVFTTYLLDSLAENPYSTIIDQEYRINKRLFNSGYDQSHVVSSSHIFDKNMSIYNFLNFSI